MSAAAATLRDIWLAAAARLEHAGITDARFEAEVLLRHVSGRSRADFYAHLEDGLAERTGEAFEAALERRRRREPLAYITGRREFYKLDFLVSPAVLIPRPESELLVECALDHLRRRAIRRAQVVDVGAGSGALGIAIVRHRRDARLLGVDVSPAALQIARRNARRLIPRRRCDWLVGDLLTAVPGALDCVVANLPYIPQDRLPELDPEIAAHEPRQALTPGPAGDELVLRLVTQLGPRLAPRGLAVLEVDGGAQAETVATAARRLLSLAQVEVLNDLAGLARAVTVLAS